MVKMKSKLLALLLVLILSFSTLLVGCDLLAGEEEEEKAPDFGVAVPENLYINGERIPSYSGSATYVVNGGVPFFTDDEITSSGFYEFTELDPLGRCGVAWGSIGLDTMPTDGQRDIHADFGAYCYKGLRHSFCHGWAAGPVPYAFEHILGITVEDAGCKTVRINPHLDGLQWAKGKFPTPFGVISLSVERKNGQDVITDLELPEGVSVVK